MNTNVRSHQNRLDNLFKKFEVFNQLKSPEAEEIKAHWSRYLCVLVSGFVEFALIEIYTDYAIRRSTSKVANYVSQQLEGFQNPKMQKVLTLAGSFSAQWREEIEKASNFEQFKIALDYVIDKRNKIAHGELDNVTYGTLKNNYQTIKTLITFIDDQCTR
ncbi:MAG: HEPN domain-containing protein [Anaerolineae bacterium]|jgi:hypothetical protein|nr:HEPN domain-containing protein [Anaerolineae bacterium]